ncbi:VolA/Pla-1 family phospholipase [Moritella sp. F3]|uniref:VolA/Pla-1 family phospholipase n=1 Tax=Moritella sp. F3 TaxID=2718882 RepID=UPI0018E156A0|nr:VolA/Pla-1 family phospholipase [Moritella sp. F3]GIC78673.1 lipase [Moritella sp. F1]GIC81399.1 lipase [Moritella sp. F3]
MPRKTILASLIISSLALTACDSDTEVLDVKENKLYTSSRIQFDPSNGVVSLPNDLLFSGTTDGTLQLPDELTAIAAASAAGETMTYDDNTYAIGALDGWSTTQPISIGVDLYENRTLDAASIEQAGAVRIFPVGLGGPLSASTAAACQAASGQEFALTVCDINPADELEYGLDKDFITAVNGHSIAVIPLKPLAENASYMYLTTNLIKDSEGESVNGSVTYQLLKRDYAENPIGDPSDPADASAIGLQKLINHYDSDIITAVGIDASTVTHTGVFTTQSIFNVIDTAKGMLYKAKFDASKALINGAYPNLLPVVSAANTTLINSVYNEVPALQAIPIINTQAQNTDLYASSITVPYYLEENVNNSYWKAAGDSPVTILGAVQKGLIDDPTLIGACGMSIASAAADTSGLVGCNLGIDPTKLLTRFNPLANPINQQTLAVQITVPNNKTKPGSGWPVNIAVHGLGTYKETTLMNAGALAEQGLATIAIDMPLHGSRGYDDGSGGDYEISATDSSFGVPYTNGSVTNFVNIASGLTVRDNFRQAISDLLALRMQISDFKDTDGSILFDATQVSVHGLSLGAITASMFTAVANDPTLSAVFGVKSVSLVAPAGGLTGVFLDSPAFGPVVIDGLVAQIAESQGYTADQIKGIISDRTSAAYLGFASHAEALIPGLLFSVQTQIEASDPINYAVRLADNTDNIHLIEIIGDITTGGTNPSDQTLPNQGTSGSLVGTEPLIKALELGCIDNSDTTTVNAGVVRFMKGHHSSLINPTSSGIATISATAALDATLEMQKQVATHAKAASNSLELSNVGAAVGTTPLFSTCL